MANLIYCHVLLKHKIPMWGDQILRFTWGKMHVRSTLDRLMEVGWRIQYNVHPGVSSTKEILPKFEFSEISSSSTSSVASFSYCLCWPLSSLCRCLKAMFYSDGSNFI